MQGAGDAESGPKIPHFDVVLRGYNQRQVNERVTRLTYDLRTAASSRDEAQTQVRQLSETLGGLRRALADTRQRLHRLSLKPNSTEAMTERVRLMMQLAEEESPEFKRQADEWGKATR